MAVYSTSSVVITAGGVTLAGFIADFTVTLNMSTVEVTSVGDSDQFHVPGIRSGTAQGTLFYDQANAAISALELARRNGTEVTFVFTWHTGASYTCQALVTSFAPTVAPGDVVKASISLQITGAVTIA